MKLRQYQIDLSNKGCDILTKFGIVYFAMQVRTGKTLTALNTAELFGAKKVLFLTKKKAIGSFDSFEHR
jgi:superfamily II DNA or RNA helicase